MRFNPLYPLDPSQVTDLRHVQRPMLPRQRGVPIRQIVANPYPMGIPHAAHPHFHIPLPNLFPDSHPAHLPMAPPSNTTTVIEIAPHLRQLSQWLLHHHGRR